MSYYSVIAGYGMSYILMSLIGTFQGESITSITDMYDTLDRDPFLYFGMLFLP